MFFCKIDRRLSLDIKCFEEKRIKFLVSFVILLKFIIKIKTSIKLGCDLSFILPKEKWYTSILVRPKNETDPTIARSVSSTSTENAAMEFLKKLSDKIFDVIRKSEQFITIAEKLKLTAHE